MQQLFVRNLSENGLPLPQAMYQLPLWPSVSADQAHLTTKEVIRAENLAFVVPWIKDYRRFTDFDKPFQKSSLDDVTMMKDYVLPTLPESLDEQTKAPYIRLMAAVTSSLKLKTRFGKKKHKSFDFVIPLEDYRLAAGRDGVLRHARSLFDHSDAIFAAAFRNQQDSRFLIPDVRRHLTFWRELGLRSSQRGYRAEDYLDCLDAVEKRLIGDHDQHVTSDARIVIGPLCIHDGRLLLLDKPTWGTIAGLRIFAVRQDLRIEPEHRRQQMEFLLSQQNTLSLRQIVRYEFAGVCWSQVPFPLQEPTTLSFRNCGHGGKPTCGAVWQHLAFLAELASSVEESNIDGFVDDLQKTYEYLNLNLQDSKNNFTMKTAAIWWNAEEFDPNNVSAASVRLSWTSLDNLLLDTPCDALPLLAVQPFLGRFSALLKGLGCRSICYPEIKASSEDRSDSGLTLIRGLWQERALTDVVFGAEGKEIPAHKVVLATRSMYCRRQFEGFWASTSHGYNKEPIQVQDMSYNTLQILIDFCYEANEDWAAAWRLKEGDELPTIADNLDGLLDVLVAADRWLMPDLFADAESQVLAGIKFFVRPDNVTAVRNIADEANATKLRNYCDEYAIYNVEAVLLANADTN